MFKDIIGYFRILAFDLSFLNLKTHSKAFDILLL